MLELKLVHSLFDFFPYLMEKKEKKKKKREEKLVSLIYMNGLIFSFFWFWFLLVRVGAGAISTRAKLSSGVSVCESECNGCTGRALRVSNRSEHRRTRFQGNSLRPRNGRSLRGCRLWGFLRWRWRSSATKSNGCSHNHHRRHNKRKPFWGFTLHGSDECLHGWYALLPTPKILRTFHISLSHSHSFSFYLAKLIMIESWNRVVFLFFHGFLLWLRLLGVICASIILSS